MSEEIFKTLGTAVGANPAAAKVEFSNLFATSFYCLFFILDICLQKINGVFQWKLTGPNSEWVVDLKEGKVYKGTVSKADVTLTLKDKDFQDLMTGKANGQQLFMSGKIKFKGNMSLLMKMSELQSLLQIMLLRLLGKYEFNDEIFLQIGRAV